MNGCNISVHSRHSFIRSSDVESLHFNDGLGGKTNFVFDAVCNSDLRLLNLDRIGANSLDDSQTSLLSS